MTAVCIGIDPGALTGWAMLDLEGKRLMSGTWRLTGPKDKVHGARFFHLRNHLRLLLSTLTAAEHVAIGYERPMVILPKGQPPDAIRGRIHAMADLFGYSAIVEEVAFAHGHQAWPYEPSTIKKRAGSGRLGKPEMKLAAAMRWPCPDDRETYGEDESDALFCAEVARHQLALQLGVLL